MKAMVCPQCGANLNLDDSREFGFCTYCGAKIQINETVIVKHSGAVSIESNSFVQSLCRKGFQEIDRGAINEASETFNKALEYDCDNVDVIIGKMLACPIYNSQNKVNKTKFDKYYYDVLKSKFNDISERETSLINTYNCKFFLKCYLFFDDKARADYVLEKYPQALDFDVFNSKYITDCEYTGDYDYKNKDNKKFIDSDSFSGTKLYNEYEHNIATLLKADRNIDVIEYLLKKYSPADIFNCLHYLAYNLKHSHEYHGKHIYYLYEYHLSFIPFHVFQKLIEAGLSLDTKVFFLKPYNPDGYIEHSEYNETIRNFFTSYALSRHIKFISSVTGDGNIEHYKLYIRQQQPTDTAKKQGCYVATCVYGSYDCPQVWTLRRYRDNTLDKTPFGKAFIKIYYAVSPKIIKLFGETSWFKSFWKKRLDKMVYKLNGKGIENTPYNDLY